MVRRRVLAGFTPGAVVAVAALACLPALSSAQTLNMSTDLVRLGIAARDLNPNDPTLDARPLFEAATDHVRAHPQSEC